VTEWELVFLGVIAAATLLMALMQVAAVVVAARLARQAQEAAGKAQSAIATAQEAIASVREDIRPLIARANTVAEEAARTASLVTAQAEKVDRLVTDLSTRIDDTAVVVQNAIVTPAREALAVLAGVKAALATFRAGADWRRRTTRSEEEDPLFIG
jgi:hypothetical protein